jgi:hypothetical protein
MTFIFPLFRLFLAFLVYNLIEDILFKMLILVFKFRVSISPWKKDGFCFLGCQIDPCHSWKKDGVTHIYIFLIFC